MTSELPRGWELAKLEEVATLHQGYGFPKDLQGSTSGDLAFFKVSDISRAIAAGSDTLDAGAHYVSNLQAQKLRATPLPEGSVVFARIGEAIRLNRRALLARPALVDNNVIGTKARAGIEDRYLLHFLRTVRLGDLSQATTVPAVRSSDIAGIEIPIPPTNEQRRIVSKIDELFSRIDEGERALERVQNLVERYRQSVLKAAVTGELTRDWREKNKDKLESGEALLARILKARRGAWEAAELDKMKAKGITPANDKWKHRYEEPAGPDTSGLPDLPTGWVWSSGAQLFEWASGDFLPAKAMQLGDVPVYGGNGVNGQHSQANVDFATIVVGRVGVHCGNVHLSEPKCWVTDNAIYATRLPAPASLEFLLICLRSAQLGKTSQGGAQPFVNQKALNEVAIPIPPLDEQITIVDLLAMESSRLDGALATVWAESRRTAALRQAVLKSAFSGLLVSQQPDDEPAAALLERIAANRSQTPAKPRRGITRESGKA